MPDFSASQIPPPANWQDFESLCWDLWRTFWPDPTAQKNGRNGQPQCGVDIVGQPVGRMVWIGIQCKGKDKYTKKRLTKKELESAIRKAKKFKPKLDSFIIATTGPKDVAIEKRAREITERHVASSLFAVTVLGWSDIVALLADYPDLIVKHYPWCGSVAWDAEACLAARHVNNHHFQAHRGAILWCPNVTAVFGNDGYDMRRSPGQRNDVRAQQEVERLRDKLRQLGMKELGFGTNEDRYSWVLLVDSSDVRTLNKLIWTCYPMSALKLAIEEVEAFRSIHTYWLYPAKEQCLKR